MKKNLGTMLGIVGWGVGWGVSWAIIHVYQNSVAFGFGIQSAGFYLGWYLRIVGLFVFGWLIAGFSTGLMLLTFDKLRITQGIFVGLLWGILALPLGIILSWIYKHAGGPDSIYFIYLACFFTILLPIGFGSTGFIGGYLAMALLKRALPSLSRAVPFKYGLAWGTGLAVGAIIGLVSVALLERIPYIGATQAIDNGVFLETTRVGIWSIIYGVFPGLIGGFVGGSIAGSMGTITIRRAFDKQTTEGSTLGK